VLRSTTVNVFAAMASGSGSSGIPDSVYSAVPRRAIITVLIALAGGAVQGRNTEDG
jgi:hypothetical protein